MKRLVLYLGLILLLFALHGTVFAATYYVSSAGSDTNLGTQSSPWKTIQKAANTMAAGDTVTVLAGSYAFERVQVSKSGSAGVPIIFQAQGTVVMKGFKIVANYITVKGFEIANTDYIRWNTGVSSGIYIKGSNNIIESNYIHDSALNGITIYGTPSEPTVSSNNIIKSNRLYHNEEAGIDVSGRNNLIESNEVWGTVQCLPSLTTVEDNASDNPNHLKCPNYPVVSGLDADFMRYFGQGHIFRKNYSHDIHINPPEAVDPHIDCFQTWADSYDEVAKNILFERNYCENLNVGMYAFMLAGDSNKTVVPTNITIRNNIFRVADGINTAGGVDYLYVYNNLFANNLSFGANGYPGAIGLDNIPHAFIKNNIFYNQPYHTVTVIGNTSGVDLDYNLAYNSDGSKAECVKWGNYDTCQPLGHNIWNGNPQFVNPSGNDFHLVASSPAVDKGTNVGVTDDYDGTPRPQGSGYDIGVYEYSSGFGTILTPTPTPSLTVAAPTPTRTPTPVIKAGDANNDGHVDETDYGIWLSHFGQTVSGGRTVGDFDEDGKVDGVDYSEWLKNYGI